MVQTNARIYSTGHDVALIASVRCWGLLLAQRVYCHGSFEKVRRELRSTFLNDRQPTMYVVPTRIAPYHGWSSYSNEESTSLTT